MKRDRLGAAAVDPDPRSDPGLVPDDALFVCPLTGRNSDTIPGRLLLTLEGTAAQTVSVEIWVLDNIEPDRQASLPKRPTQPEKAARQFYNATPGGALVVTVGEMIEFSAVMPMPGTVYIRQTAVTVAPSTLKVACAN